MSASIEWTTSPFKYTTCNGCDGVVDKVEVRTGYCANCLVQVTA